jgi:chemotaxis protein CheC
MGPTLTDAHRGLLRMIFDRGAEGASLALSKWLGREVRLAVSDVELVELEDAGELLGPPETLVAACIMGLTGRLTGSILLVFEDRSGLALVDILLHQPVGTTTAWGELEQSAAKETTNIIGCAYINALAAHLPGGDGAGATGSGGLVPTPPSFLHEFAGSLLEFALMEQALERDRLLLIRSEFAGGPDLPQLNWTLLLVPSPAALEALAASLAELERRPSA